MLDSEAIEEDSSVFGCHDRASETTASCNIDPVALLVDNIESVTSLRALPHVIVETLDTSRVASMTPLKEAKSASIGLLLLVGGWELRLLRWGVLNCMGGSPSG